MKNVLMLSFRLAQIPLLGISTIAPLYTWLPPVVMLVFLGPFYKLVPVIMLIKKVSLPCIGLVTMVRINCKI